MELLLEPEISRGETRTVPPSRDPEAIVSTGYMQRIAVRCVTAMSHSGAGQSGVQRPNMQIIMSYYGIARMSLI